MKICINCMQDDDKCKCIWGAIRELQKKVKNLEEENNELRTCRIPHKCPVCDGFGKNIFLIAQEVKVCPACEGKGIVWDSK